jgi:hypothetical protein
VEHGDLLRRKVTSEELTSEGTKCPEGRSAKLHLSHPLEKVRGRRSITSKDWRSGKKGSKGALTASCPKGNQRTISTVDQGKYVAFDP